jgi:hypothetical protein
MKLKYAIDKQIEKNSHLNLLYDNLRGVLCVDGTFSDMLVQVHQKGIDNPNNIFSYAVEKTISTIYSVNQFICITTEQKNELYNIYKESWLDYDPRHSYDSILRHHQRLTKWISRLYPPDFVAALRGKQKIGSVVDARYSADFQIYVLGLQIENILEPIIDIGCGSQAILVRYLCQQKDHVFGIDRKIDYKSIYTKEIDWLEFKFTRRFYGTIIANMSFSNHLIYHIQNRTAYIKAYLLKYKEILESIKNGGLFVYAPSLPFIEERLDREQYSVEITDFGNKNRVTKIRYNIA